MSIRFRSAVLLIGRPRACAGAKNEFDACADIIFWGRPTVRPSRPGGPKTQKKRKKEDLPKTCCKAATTLVNRPCRQPPRGLGSGECTDALALPGRSRPSS